MSLCVVNYFCRWQWFLTSVCPPFEDSFKQQCGERQTRTLGDSRTWKRALAIATIFISHWNSGTWNEIVSPARSEVFCPWTAVIQGRWPSPGMGGRPPAPESTGEPETPIAALNHHPERPRQSWADCLMLIKIPVKQTDIIGHKVMKKHVFSVGQISHVCLA